MFHNEITYCNLTYYFNSNKLNCNLFFGSILLFLIYLLKIKKINSNKLTKNTKINDSYPT